jgi:hypothetical protein
MTIGIAALWWEHVELLPEFVRMMRVRGWDRLLFVDNASSISAHVAYQVAAAVLGPGASVLRMAENDVVRGWNAGMAALGTDVVIQMSNDVEMMDERWLAWLLEGLEPGIVQGPVGAHQEGLFYVDGCLCAMMRADWERLGGLDEGYLHPGYWSDVDLSYRAQLLGMTTRKTQCGIRHLRNASTGGTPDAESQRRWLANRERYDARCRVSPL